MPSITRRRLVAAGAVAAGGGYAGYRLLDGAPDATFETWNPDRGTWPLPRYDPANTAHSPDARPPRDPPSRRVLGSVAGSGRSLHPLVGRSRVVLFGPGLSVAPRDGAGDGWTRITDARVRYAGIGPDGRLHAVERSSRVNVAFDVVGYDGTAEAYRVHLGEGFPEWCTVGATEVYCGLPSRNVAAIDSGSHDWRVEGAKSALADGRLYSASPDGVRAYAERSGLDRRVTPGPERAWSGPAPSRDEVYPPAVANGRLVVGTFGPQEESGVLVAHDATTGERLWEPLTLGGNVTTPAIAGDHRGFAAVPGGGTGSGAVVALDLTTGDVAWRDDTNWHAFETVLGGDTLVVTGQVRDDEGPTAGRVRAYDAASGEPLWTETFREATEARPGVALVDDRVLVTAGGTLYELG